jgi:hypothetical protein
MKPGSCPISCSPCPSYCVTVECFLQEDGSGEAELFLNKASKVMQDVTDRTLQLRYRTTYARVLDANKKFVDAAVRYYELSSATDPDVSSDISDSQTYPSYDILHLACLMRAMHVTPVVVDICG